MLSMDRVLQQLVRNEYPLMHQERNVRTFINAVRKCQKSDPGETPKELIDQLEQRFVEFRNQSQGDDESLLDVLKRYKRLQSNVMRPISLIFRKRIRRKISSRRLMLPIPD